jgi:hypothetical protein
MMGAANAALRLAGLAILLLVAGCGRQVEPEKPPRLDTPFEIPAQTSTAVLPVQMQVSALEAIINRSVPEQLWQIDRQEKKCVPGQRITICPVPKRECKNGKCRMVGCEFGLYRTKITPDFSCQIIGKVVRGRIRLSGQGDRVLLTMPVSARLGARNVAGFLKETATAKAELRALIGVDVDKNWQLVAKVSLDKSWQEPPGIDFLGKRISLVSKADPALQKLLDDIERRVQADVAKLPFKAGVTEGWRAGFAVVQLNRRNPPVYMKVTPRQISFGGMTATKKQIELRVGLEAETRTYVGEAPLPDAPTPLPAPAARLPEPGLAFSIAVLADYAELVPVVDRTLAKLARKGVELPRLGAVDMEFGSVEIYPTNGGRIAIGIPATAHLRISPFRATKGMIWLTGRVKNEVGSQRVHVEDLQIIGRTDRDTVNLLFRVFEDPEILAEVSKGLSHDFAPDYERVLAAARKAIAQRQFGRFVLRAEATDVTNGTIMVTGKGLFMPVTVRGNASLRYEAPYLGLR